MKSDQVSPVTTVGRSRPIGLLISVLVVGAVFGAVVGHILFSVKPMLVDVVPARDKADCLNLPEQDGHRPLCAVTIYKGGECLIDKLNKGCSCHEFQVKSCLLSDASKACKPGAECGVVTCEAKRDDSSKWSKTCKPIH